MTGGIKGWQNLALQVALSEAIPRRRTRADYLPGDRVRQALAAIAMLGTTAAPTGTGGSGGPLNVIDRPPAWSTSSIRVRQRSAPSA
jgi:hypothetical protein